MNWKVWELQAQGIVLNHMCKGETCHFPAGREGIEESPRKQFFKKSEPGMSYTHLSSSCSVGEPSHKASCNGGWEVESLYRCSYGWSKIYVYGRGGAGGWIFGRQVAFFTTEIFPYGYGC